MCLCVTAEQLCTDTDPACCGSRIGQTDLPPAILLLVCWCSQQPAVAQGYVQLVQGYADQVSRCLLIGSLTCKPCIIYKIIFLLLLFLFLFGMSFSLGGG